MRAAAVGKPVIVTETGIPDNDDSRRELWATSYLKAVGHAHMAVLGHLGQLACIHAGKQEA
jgi:hypothetical protein